MTEELAYLYLNIIQKDLINDTAPDKYIEAIEKAKEILIQRVTGYSQTQRAAFPPSIQF